MVSWWTSTLRRDVAFVCSHQDMPQGHDVKNNCGTFSHCNPVFPGKGLWERDRFLNNYTTLLCRSGGSQLPAAPAEQGPLSLSLPVLQQGPMQAAGETSKAAQWSLWVSITWNIKQHIRGRLTCLFDFGGQKDFKRRKKSINVKRVRKGLFIPEDLGEKLDHLSPERFISIIIHRPGSPILCSTMLLNNNQQEKCLQFSRWKGVQRIRFTYFEVKEDFLAQKDKHSFVRYKLVLLYFSCNLPFY